MNESELPRRQGRWGSKQHFIMYLKGYSKASGNSLFCMSTVETTKNNVLIAATTNRVRNQKTTLRINVVMEYYRLSTTRKVLRTARQMSPKGSINLANPTLGKEGCTKWPLEVPFSSAILLMWLLTFMHFGLSPVLNCSCIKILDLFGNKSALEVQLLLS